MALWLIARLDFNSCPIKKTRGLSLIFYDLLLFNKTKNMNENYLMWLNWILWTALSNVSIGVFALPAHQQHPLTSRLEDVDSSPMVFILSLDGFRREYLTMADSLGLKIPNIRRLMRQGSCTASPC